MEKWLEENLSALTEALSPCKNCPVANTERDVNLPGTGAVIAVLEQLLAVLYPGCHGQAPVAHDNCHAHLQDTLRTVALKLCDQAHRAFEYACRRATCQTCDDCEAKARQAVVAVVLVRVVASNRCWTRVNWRIDWRLNCWSTSFAVMAIWSCSAMTASGRCGYAANVWMGRPLKTVSALPTLWSGAELALGRRLG